MVEEYNAELNSCSIKCSSCNKVMGYKLDVGEIEDCPKFNYICSSSMALKTKEKFKLSVSCKECGMIYRCGTLSIWKHTCANCNSKNIKVQEEQE